MTSPADWATDPEAVHECTRPGCEDCSLAVRIADAGARAITRHIGIPDDGYADLDPETIRHYRLIASEVMAAMSEAMIDLGVATPTEETTGD